MLYIFRIHSVPLQNSIYTSIYVKMFSMKSNNKQADVSNATFQCDYCSEAKALQISTQANIWARNMIKTTHEKELLQDGTQLQSSRAKNGDFYWGGGTAVALTLIESDSGDCRTRWNACRRFVDERRKSIFSKPDGAQSTDVSSCLIES